MAFPGGNPESRAQRTQLTDRHAQRPGERTSGCSGQRQLLTPGASSLLASLQPPVPFMEGQAQAGHRWAHAGQSSQASSPALSQRPGLASPPSSGAQPVEKDPNQGHRGILTFR